MKLNYLILYIKMNSKQIRDLNIRPETIPCIKENIQTKLKDLTLRENFVNLNPEVRKFKVKISGAIPN